LFHWFNANTRIGSRRNIAAHYDLGNEFFEAFLDETMTYSCGIFPTRESTMAEASREKLDRLCRRLQLHHSDHLIEIGSGWGSMAMHAAGEYGCRVTTTTISRQQHALATRRVHEAGLSDRVTILFKDYRDLDGEYDKLVSVEMIEAVGWEYYPTYFAKCASLLKPDGMMAVQAITVNDQYYETQKRDVDFIKRYIFPGGCLPSITALCDAATHASDLSLYHLEDIGMHYVRTLLEWRAKFLANLDRIRALKDDESFLRMWDYYLCYCAGAFAERHVSTAQLVFTKRGARPDAALLHGTG
jgi:cyclopropane-fatty-acyl-phospholipid synthase